MVDSDYTFEFYWNIWNVLADIVHYKCSPWDLELANQSLNYLVLLQRELMHCLVEKWLHVLPCLNKIWYSNKWLHACFVNFLEKQFSAYILRKKLPKPLTRSLPLAHQQGVTSYAGDALRWWSTIIRYILYF